MSASLNNIPHFLVSSPQAILLTNTENRLLFFNHAAEKLIGWKQKEVLGKKTLDLLVPDDQQADARRILEIILKEGYWEGFFTILNKAREEITVKAASSAARNEAGELIGFMTIVTHSPESLIEAENEKKRLNQLKAILDTIPAYIFIKDYNGHFLMVNKTMADFFGESPDRVNGKTDLNYGASAAQMQSYLQTDRQVIETGKQLFIPEQQIQRADGSMAWLQTVKMPFELPGLAGEKVVLGISTDITARKQAEEKLRQSESQFKELIEELPDIMLVHQQGTIIYANRAALEAVQYTEEEFLGTHVIDYVLESDRALVLKNFEKRAKNLRVEDYEIRVVPKDKQLRTAIVRTKDILFDGKPAVITILIDITERKRAEQVLAESEEKFRNLAQSSPFAIMIYQGDKWVFTNKTGEEISGYTAEELYQMNYWDIVTDEYKDLIQQRGQQRQQGKGVEHSYEFRIQRKDGSAVWVLLTGTLIQFNGKPAGLISVVDIENRKQAEQKIAQGNKRMNTILRTIPDLMFVINSKGKVLEFYNPDENRLPLRQEDVVGQMLYDLVPAEEAERHLNIYKKCLSEKTTQTFDYQHYNERLSAVFEIRVSPLGPDQVLAIVRNLSAERQMRNEIEYLSSMQALLTKLGNRFINIRASETEDAVNEAMAEIGQFTGVDRVYLFDYNWEEEIMVNTFEWCSEGTTPEIENLKAVPNHLVPEWVQAHLKGETIDVPDVSKLEPDDNLRSILEPQGIQSLTTLPMIYEGHCLGYIGFDSVKKVRSWSTDELAILKLFAELLTNLRVKGQVENKLQETEAVNQFITSNIIDAIILTDAKGNYSYISPSHKTITGRGEEVLGRSIVEHVHPDDLEKVISAIRAGRDKNFENKVEYRYLHPEKGYVWFESVGKRHYNAQGKLLGLITTRDISSRKKFEQELLRLGRAVEQSPVSIIITDIDGNIEYVNPIFTERTGYKTEEVIGKNPRFLKTEYNTAEEYQHLWHTIKSGKTWRGELCNRKKNGEYIWEMSNITPVMDSEGHIINYLAVKEDITEKKQLIDQLIEAKEKAEESSRLKTAFINTISHEVRTPLNGIIGFSGLLADPQVDPESKAEFLRNLDESSDRLLNTVSDILEVSMIVSGNRKVKPKAFNLIDLLEQVYEKYKAAGEKANNSFELNTPPSHPDFDLYSDPDAVKAILTELLENAFKFTNDGHIELGAGLQGDTIRIFVKDTGMGIAPERHKLIFDFFTHTGTSSTRLYEGSGLGLSIAKGLTDLLEGRIDLQSEPQKGTQFTLLLPKHLSGQKMKPEETVKVQLSPLNRKILVVEDEDMNYLYLNRILSMNQLNDVIRASNGQEAIDKVKQEEDICLVLMDLKLPVMGGLDATRIIREINPGLPIIAITAYAMDADKQKALQAGCAAYLSKPYSKEELMKLLNKFLG